MAVRNHDGTGTPRVKTYSAASGFAYQYQFKGHSAFPDGDHYRFATTQDRRAVFDVFVSIPFAAIEPWELSQRRSLSPTERYAVAKLALFAAFDQAIGPEQIPKPILVDSHQLSDILNTLDI